MENRAMTSCLKDKTIQTLRGCRLLAVVLIIFTGMSVGNSFAEKTSPDQGQGFNSPQEAITAIISATRKLDTEKALAILGPDAEELIFSGDKVQSQEGADDFLQKYDEKHHLEMTNPTSATLIIGKGEWPFPIPIVKVGENWFFDVAAGKDEILNRRIGENELNVIQVMLAYVEAQLEYAGKDRDGDGVREFAQKVTSDAGKKNGLYWLVKDGEELSPLGLFIAEATSEGYDLKSGEPQPYHGYYYKIMTRQGKKAPGGAYDYIVNGNMILGFGLVAYPAKYGISGIMTFAVNQEGVVYEVDLGEKTAKLVNKRRKYNIRKNWQKVSDQDLGNN